MDFFRSLGIAALLGIVSSAPGIVPDAVARGIQGPTLSYAPVVESVSQGVVGISVTRESESDNPLMRDPAFRRFFEDLPDSKSPQEKRQTPRASGSGVVIDAPAGYVVTNHHVIARARRIVVVLPDRREFDAKLVGADPGTDIALLQIKPERLTAVPLGDSDAMRVGDIVLAIGNPFGMGQTVTSGIVSALGRGISPEGYEDYVQTDAPINPGNSGGALINLNGELIGINTAIFSPRARGGGPAGNIGIGFAVPSRMAGAIVAQLKSFGEVRRGRLGVRARDLKPAEIRTNGMRTVDGAFVETVERGSPADTAGVQRGDIIHAVGGRRIRGAANLRNELALIPVGTRVGIDVVRSGSSHRIEATIAAINAAAVARAQSATTPGEDRPRVVQGANLLRDTRLMAGRDGITVAEVPQSSPAFAAGIRPGDILLAVDRKPLRSVEDATRALAGSGEMQLAILRGDSKLRLTLRN